MHDIQIPDDDLIEAFYASELLERLSRGHDDPSILRDTLSNTSAKDHVEIAKECAAKAIDIDAGRYGDEEHDTWSTAGWANQLRRIASQLTEPGSAGTPS